MTIYKRGDKHCVSVYDPRAKKMRWIGSYGTLAEAQAEEARATQGITCNEYAESWLVQHPRSERTNAIYRRRARAFAEAHTGVPLASLTAARIVPWAQAQSDGVFETARTLFNDAISDGLHPGPNPLRGMRPERPRHRLVGLDEPELHRLIDCSIDAWGAYGYETLAPLIVTTAFQRLTLSEVASLRRDDVRESSLVVLSAGAWWEMTLEPEVRAALAQIPLKRDGPLLFTSKNGAPFSPCRIAYYWTPIRVAFGSTSLRFDDLRSFRHAQPPPRRQFLRLAD